MRLKFSAVPRAQHPLRSRGLVGAKRRDVISVFKFMKANLALYWIQTIVSTLDISRSGFYVWHGVIVAHRPACLPR
jgi:hypothetical protein